jgi:hypothetical protein
LAAELMIWSMACMAKLKVMNSRIGLEAPEGGAHRQAREAVLGDRRVDDAAVAEFLEQPLAELVGALVLGHFLAHQEHAFRRGASPRPWRRAAPRAPSS